MCVIVFYKSPFFDTDTFILNQTPTTFRKTEISAVAAVTKCFGAGKVCFAQPAACHVVRVAKQAIRVFTNVFNASRMSQTFGNGNIVVVLAALLRVLAPYNKKKAGNSRGIACSTVNLLVQRFHGGEQQYVANGLIVCKQHNHTVNTDTQTTCRGHTVF